MKKTISNIAYFLGSMAILIGIWQLISIITKAEIPSPVSTWAVFKELMAEPFYDRGPNDKGIGNNLILSEEFLQVLPWEVSSQFQWEC
jgi:nitrate/nitrite transport system permease protein